MRPIPRPPPKAPPTSRQHEVAVATYLGQALFWAFAATVAITALFFWS